MKRRLPIASHLIAALVVVTLAFVVPARSQSPSDTKYLGVFPALLEGLKATPGCLGVETARTGSGKQVIFAWFADKAAARAWYYSDVHQRMMKQYHPSADYHTPLDGISEDGPILAIASVTLSQAPDAGNQLPFSQIAIELYRPINGGIAMGGRFAPDALHVPGLREGFVPKSRP
jgi:heme-degrading monooxygenase HmoA